MEEKVKRMIEEIEKEREKIRKKEEDGGMRIVR